MGTLLACFLPFCTHVCLSLSLLPSSLETKSPFVAQVGLELVAIFQHWPPECGMIGMRHSLCLALNFLLISLLGLPSGCLWTGLNMQMLLENFLSGRT